MKEQRPVFVLGDRIVDLESGIVQHGSEEYPLTAKEIALLSKLYENRNRIVTSDALCQAAWNDDYYGYENTLMVHIRRIREKIEDNPSAPEHLLTVRGLGIQIADQRGVGMEGSIRILRRFVGATMVISILLLIINFILLGVLVFSGMNEGNPPARWWSERRRACAIPPAPMCWSRSAADC